MSGIKNKLVNQLEQDISKRPLSDTGAAPLISRRNSDIVLQRPFWIFSGKTAFNQLSKSTSSQKIRRKRDISSDPPQSEFLGTASTFTELESLLTLPPNSRISGASRCGNKFYHIATPLRRQLRKICFIAKNNFLQFDKFSDCLNVPRLRELGVLALVITSGLGLAINTSSTYAAGSSITITTSGSVDLSLLRSDTEAVFGRSSEQTVNVNSNHYTGYTLTIAGSDNTGRLVGTSDSSKYLASISNALAESTFNTDTYNNKWGFLPNKLYNSSTGTTTNNNIYQPSPTQSTPTIIDRTNSPTESVGNDYTLAVAARVDSTQALDSYGQTFILAATGNGYDYHIGFTDNSSTLPDDIYGHNPTSNEIPLPSTRPTKDGFVFQGWCSEETTVDQNTHETTCPNGVRTYTPGESLTLNADTANNVLLYAIWAKGYDTFEAAFAAAGKTKTNGYYTMQDMTPEICKSIVIGSPAITTEIVKNTLIDTRNNKTYLVAKYADGHCWMRENLNLVLTKGTNVVAYNFETGATFNYNPANTTQTTTGTPWEQNASDGAQSYSGDKDNCIGGTDINTSGGTGATCDANKPYERIGVLYNWAAATAQTGAQAAAAGSNNQATEVKTSICPKGWRLPASSGDYSFSNLMGYYGLPTTNQGAGYSGQLQNPLNFNRPGDYLWGSGALYNRGAGGYFWSSVGFSGTSANYFYLVSSYFYPQDGASKGNGFSVRCLAV